MEAPTNPHTDLDAFNAEGGDAESRGGDHRPIQDNGTQGRNFNVQGQNTIGEHPTIPDQFAPPGTEVSEFYQQDQGLASATVGHNGNVLTYGLEGESPAAGGGLDKNTKT